MIRQSRTALTYLVLFVALCLSSLVASTSAQTVLKRQRLGNNAEDMEFIPSGPYANQFAILDGVDVIGVPVFGSGHARVRKLFDVKKLPLFQAPRGIAYVESERLFVFNDPLTDPSQLIFSDEHGNPAGVRTIQFPAGQSAAHAEAITYIRRGSPFFPDHIAEIIYDDSNVQHIEIIQRDGRVVADIVPDAAIQDVFAAGLAFIGPDRFMVGTLGSIFLTDLNGHIVTGPVTLGPDSFEGVGQTLDGRLVATAYGSGTVLYFDSNLNRLPAADQSYKVGIGVSRPAELTWSSTSNEFLIRYDTITPSSAILGVPASLDSKHVVVDLLADGLIFDGPDVTYLPDEQRIGVVATLEKQIRLYDNAGLKTETLDLSAIGRPIVAQYLLTTPRQFAAEFAGPANRGFIKILSRAGAVVRQIDLHPFGIDFRPSFAYFNPAHPSGGELLLATLEDFLILDLNGNLVSDLPYAKPLDIKWGFFGVTAITTGQYAGSFAAMAPDTSEVVIFTLP